MLTIIDNENKVSNYKTREINKSGLLSAVGANIIWGLFPLYWKQLKEVSSLEVMSFRVIFSLLFMLIILILSNKWKEFKEQLVIIIQSKQKVITLVFSAFFIGSNWLLYIWAVNNDQIVETSLGYYINPLISVIYAVIFFRESLILGQKIAFFLACFGVILLTWNIGYIPWISILLANSFSLYGICKKILKTSAFTSTTLETAILFPVAIIYFFYLYWNEGATIFYTDSPEKNVLLVGTGIVSTVPLFLFARGANLLPFNILGFLQYLSPTIVLFIGIFIYNESFATSHFIAFLCIWMALFIYYFSIALGV